MSLKRRAAAGVKWTGIAFAVTTATRLVVLAVLARLLAPSDFGVVASLTALIGILQAFGDLGVGNAIIQRREVGPDQLSSLYWTTQLAGIVVCIALWLAAPLVASWFSEPRLESLVGIVALRFVLGPAGVPFASLLQRELEFRKLTAIQIAAVSVSALVSIVMAYGGYGVYALVWGELAGVVAHSALMIALGWSQWRPKVRLRREDLRGYGTFMLHQVGERAFTQFAMNIDYLLIGVFLGPAALGMYSIAFELASLPTRTINPVFTRVAFPVFARMQDDDDALGRGYVELTRILAVLQFPLLVGIGVLAHRIVPVFLGSGWDATVPLIEILAALGAFRVVCNLAGSAFLAKGRTQIGFWWAAFTAAVSGAVFWILVPYGLTVLAIGWVILIAVYWILLTALLRLLIKLPVMSYLRALLRPVAIASALAATMLVGDEFITESGMEQGPAIAILLGLGGVVAAALTWLLEGRFVLSQLRLLVPSRETP